MGYYEQLSRAKDRVVKNWFAQVRAGELVTIDEIFYDLDNQKLIYSEKAIIKYIERACTIEGLKFNNGVISLQ